MFWSSVDSWSMRDALSELRQTCTQRNQLVQKMNERAGCNRLANLISKCVLADMEEFKRIEVEGYAGVWENEIVYKDSEGWDQDDCHSGGKLNGYQDVKMTMCSDKIWRYQLRIMINWIIYQIFIA